MDGLVADYREAAAVLPNHSSAVWLYVQACCGRVGMNTSPRRGGRVGFGFCYIGQHSFFYLVPHLLGVHLSLHKKNGTGGVVQTLGEGLQMGLGVLVQAFGIAQDIAA